MALSDRRMSYEQISLCTAFIGGFEVPGFVANSIILQVEGVADTFGLAAPWDDIPQCSSFLRPLMSNPDDPLLWYTVLSQIPDPSLAKSKISSACDIANNPDAETDDACYTSAYFFFGNIFLSTSTSGPGISKLDIFLNLGAIVGAVQFFVWFLTIFNY